jgi:hypothetical protein
MRDFECYKCNRVVLRLYDFILALKWTGVKMDNNMCINHVTYADTRDM